MNLAQNQTLESLQAGTKVMIVGNLLDIPLCLAAMGIVLLVTRAQRAAPPIEDASAWSAEHWDRGAKEHWDGGEQNDDDEHIIPRHP